MKQNTFPQGWDEQRIRETIAHYDAQTDEEIVAEAEAAFENQTMMQVPVELVPFVRGLIGLRNLPVTALESQ